MKILITLSYNTYLEVSGKLLEELATCPPYKQEYGEGDYHYVRCNDRLDIRTASDEQIFPSKEIYKAQKDLIDENKELLKRIADLEELLNSGNESTDLTTEDEF